MDKLLLHSCCAPCSVYCVDTLRADGIEPTSLWFNPNIHPWTEYDARRRTLLEYGEKEHVEVHILEDYGLRDFVRAVSADIDHRCAHCYTIRLGTAALSDCDALCFMVADQPMLKRKTVAQELEFFRAHSENIVGLGHNGVRGNPCLFPARFFPELLSLEGDVGGSAVIKRHLDDLLLFEALETELRDVDTKEALEALKKR